MDRSTCCPSILVVFLVFVLSRVTAMIPPHPDFEMSWNKTGRVPVQQYRRNAGLHFDYETNLMSPELCRFENEPDCEEMDKSLESHAHRTLQMIQSTGRLKVLVILMQFDNHNQSELVDPSDIDILFNSEMRGGNGDVIPTGSVESFLRINSYGALGIDAFVVPWMGVGFTEEECLFDNSGMHKDFQKCFWPILDLLDELHVDLDHPFDWNDYDQNSDRFIDSLVVMHSGYGAEWGGMDPDEKESEDRIWSHSVGPQEERWESPSFLIDLGSYSVTSAFRGHDGGEIARIGLVVHEMIHTLGIPDLFDLSRADQQGGIGSYSLMSDAWGQGNDTALPGHLDPWSKIKLGWVTPMPITYAGDYTMMPSETAPDIFIIDNRYPEGEYLLLEHRRAIHYDANIWSYGALIWHIDDTVSMNTLAGGAYQGDAWPSNGDHYQVALIQADGLFELEQAINKGHAEDFFKEGSSLNPGGNENTYPNTDSYQGGEVIPTGISISSFAVEGMKLKFRVDGLPAAPPTLAPVAPSPQPTTAPTPSTQCLVTINANLCARHMERAITTEDCDCWNFCGNGAEQTCCKFGELCQMNCDSGGTIAGCTLFAGNAVEFMTPGSENGFYRASKLEHEILRDVLKEGSDVVSSAQGQPATLAVFVSLAWLSVRLLK